MKIKRHRKRLKTMKIWNSREECVMGSRSLFGVGGAQKDVELPSWTPFFNNKNKCRSRLPGISRDRWWSRTRNFSRSMMIQEFPVWRPSDQFRAKISFKDLWCRWKRCCVSSVRLPRRKRQRKERKRSIDAGIPEVSSPALDAVSTSP